MPRVNRSGYFKLGLVRSYNFYVVRLEPWSAIVVQRFSEILSRLMSILAAISQSLGIYRSCEKIIILSRIPLLNSSAEDMTDTSYASMEVSKGGVDT